MSRRSNRDLAEESFGLRETFLSPLRTGERILTVIGVLTVVNFFAHIPSGLTMMVGVLCAIVTKVVESQSIR